MVKYVEKDVVFSEIPDCVTLAVSISNCPFRCNGCHSDYLRNDIGKQLTEDEITEMLDRCEGVNCFLFLGDGADTSAICKYAQFIKANYPSVKTAIYSGYDNVREEYRACFDYIKTGKYDSKLGALRSRTTNQKLYKNECGTLVEITNEFWR